MTASIQSIQDLLDYKIIINSRTICFIDVIHEPALFPEWKEKLIQICNQESNLLDQLNRYFEMIHDRSQMFENKPYELSTSYYAAIRNGLIYNHSCIRLLTISLPYLNQDYQQYIKNHYNLTDTQAKNVNDCYVELLTDIAKKIISAEKFGVLNMFYNPGIKLKNELMDVLHEQKEKEEVLKLIKDIESNDIRYRNFYESIEKREHAFLEAIPLILHSTGFQAQLPLVYANIAKSHRDGTFMHNFARTTVARIIGESCKGIMTLAILPLLTFCMVTIMYPILLPLLLVDFTIAMTFHIILLSLSAIFWMTFAINSQSFSDLMKTGFNYIDEYYSIPCVNFIDEMMEQLFAVKLNALSITEYLEQNETSSPEDTFTETPNAIPDEENISTRNSPTAAPTFFEKKLKKKSIEEIDTDSDIELRV